MTLFSKNKGSVSIFLVIILVPVIVVCTVFIDVSRIKLAQGVAYSSGDLTLNTVLSRYDTKLADYYGLMASAQDIDEFYDTAEDYFKFCMVSQGVEPSDAQKWAANLTQMVKGNSDIHDLIGIDTSETTVEIEKATNANLANAAMIKEEIVEFMKYRAPIELLGELDTKDGLYNKLTSVQDKIEAMPTETRIQNEKTDYYDKENKLLKEALVIFEILEKYEALTYDDGSKYIDQDYMNRIKEAIGADKIKPEIGGVESAFREFHTKYVSNWANTDGYDQFKSVKTNVSDKVKCTVSGGPKSTLTSAIGNCKSAREKYEQKRDAMIEKINQITFAKEDSSHPVNQVQYWIQMEEEMGSTYDEYIDALTAFGTARENLKEAYDKRDPGTRTVTKKRTNPITKKEESYEDEEEYDIREDSYNGTTIGAAYDEEIGLTNGDWEKYKEPAIYDISTNMETYSKTALDNQMTSRTVATTEIQEATKDIIAEYNLIAEGQDYLQQVVDKLPGLVGLTEKYDSAYDTWSGDVYYNVDMDSDLINNDYDEIQKIEGNTTVDDSGQGLVRVDIDPEDVTAFQSRLENIIEMFQSYRDTIESIQYHGTQIFVTDSSGKVISTNDSIYNFDSLMGAATTQRNGCTAIVVNNDDIPVYQSELDTYIENTFSITDQFESLCEVTNSNQPKLHDYENWKTQSDAEIEKFDAWLHYKFDDIEVTSDETDGILGKLKDIMKSLSSKALESFGSYTNQPNLSENETNGKSDLPSAGAGIDTEQIFDVSEDDDVTEELNTSTGISALFDNIDFSSLITSGRDNLYATQYVMGMFSYETQALEGIYEMKGGGTGDDLYALADGTRITPKDAGSVYDPLLQNSPSDWWNEDKTFTLNKTLTNKMLDKTNNYSYGNEVEYILYGGTNEQNKDKIGLTMYFTRYALNLGPVFMEYWNDRSVTTIATTISSATAGVIPIPLVKMVICLGVDAAESAVDLNYLKAGLPVLFYKDKDDLFILLDLEPTSFAENVKSQTDYAGDLFIENTNKVSKNKTSESGSFTAPAFSYSDYLSLYLFIALCASQDNIYLRTADVIQVNMGNNSNIQDYSDFKLNKSITYFTLDSSIKVKPMMVTLPYAQQNGAEVLDTDTWNTFSYKATRGY